MAVDRRFPVRRVHGGWGSPAIPGPCLSEPAPVTLRNPGDKPDAGRPDGAVVQLFSAHHLFFTYDSECPTPRVFSEDLFHHALPHS